MTIGIITGLVIIALIIVLYSCNRKSKTNENIQRETVKKTTLKENPYQGLRNQAISVTPEQLKLHLDKDNDLYGIIMDWNMGNSTVTVVSFKTGDASIYISTGQALIGGYAHQTVINAAKNFVSIGQKYISKAVKSELNEPTKEKKVDFYFLTKSGKYYIEDDLELIENNKSKLTELFTAGNNVIQEYRLIAEKK